MQKYDANNKPLPLCENSVIRDVSEVHTHPSFQCIHKKGCSLHSYNHNCLGVSCTSFTGYDISVLTLATPVTYSNKISPVCLPANPQSNKQYERKVAKIAGWGYYDISKKKSTQVLRDTDVYVLSHKMCKVHWQNFEERNATHVTNVMRKGWNSREYLDNTHICTTGVNKIWHGPRQGDSGSSLIFKENGRSI